MAQNVWDILGKLQFNTHVRKNEIDPRAADNILIAWPPIINLITNEFPEAAGTDMLDYGCGTGGFCIRMHTQGYSITGIDTSEEMIATAKQHSPKDIVYIKGDHNALAGTGSYDIIVSIMTLQFIADISVVFKKLTDALKPNGMLIIADFNKDWVKECLKVPVSFADFDSPDDPKTGMKVFGDIKTPVYIREAMDYDKLAQLNGLKKMLEIYPPFTAEFLQRYPDDRPKNEPEYMIMGYRKK